MVDDPYAAERAAFPDVGESFSDPDGSVDDDDDEKKRRRDDDDRSPAERERDAFDPSGDVGSIGAGDDGDVDNGRDVMPTPEDSSNRVEGVPGTPSDRQPPREREQAAGGTGPGENTGDNDTESRPPREREREAATETRRRRRERRQAQSGRTQGSDRPDRNLDDAAGGSDTLIREPNAGATAPEPEDEVLSTVAGEESLRRQFASRFEGVEASDVDITRTKVGGDIIARVDPDEVSAGARRELGVSRSSEPSPAEREREVATGTLDRQAAVDELEGRGYNTDGLDVDVTDEGVTVERFDRGASPAEIERASASGVRVVDPSRPQTAADVEAQLADRAVQQQAIEADTGREEQLGDVDYSLGLGGPEDEVEEFGDTFGRDVERGLVSGRIGTGFEDGAFVEQYGIEAAPAEQADNQLLRAAGADASKALPAAPAKLASDIFETATETGEFVAYTAAGNDELDSQLPERYQTQFGTESPIQRIEEGGELTAARGEAAVEFFEENPAELGGAAVTTAASLPVSYAVGSRLPVGSDLSGKAAAAAIRGSRKLRRRAGQYEINTRVGAGPGSVEITKTKTIDADAEAEASFVESEARRRLPPEEEFPNRAEYDRELEQMMRRIEKRERGSVEEADTIEQTQAAEAEAGGQRSAEAEAFAVRGSSSTAIDAAVVGGTVTAAAEAFDTDMAEGVAVPGTDELAAEATATDTRLDTAAEVSTDTGTRVDVDTRVDTDTEVLTEPVQGRATDTRVDLDTRQDVDTGTRFDTPGDTRSDTRFDAPARTDIRTDVDLDPSTSVPDDRRRRGLDTFDTEAEAPILSAGEIGQEFGDLDAGVDDVDLDLSGLD